MYSEVVSKRPLLSNLWVRLKNLILAIAHYSWGFVHSMLKPRPRGGVMVVGYALGRGGMGLLSGPHLLLRYCGPPWGVLRKCSRRAIDMWDRTPRLGPLGGLFGGASERCGLPTSPMPPLPRAADCCRHPYGVQDSKPRPLGGDPLLRSTKSDLNLSENFGKLFFREPLNLSGGPRINILLPAGKRVRRPL